MIDIRFRPLSKWPGKWRPFEKRKSGLKVFSFSYAQTIRSLEKEVDRLGAGKAVVEGYWRERDILSDESGLRADAKVTDSGVVVNFGSSHGPLRIHCDYFLAWRHNLRAIALHLERLRLANNYGVGEHGEQYRGWKLLAAPGASEPAFTVEDAAKFIRLQTGAIQTTSPDSIVADPAFYRDAYREAARKLHPDVNENPKLWEILQEAKAVLDRHHGLAKEQEARE